MKPALLLLTVLLLCRFAHAADDDHKAPTPLPLGSVAPDFKLPGVDGKDHALHDYDASPVLVIVFTCNHCPTAQLYEDRLKQLVADYKDKGAAFVMINPNDPKSVRLDELGYTDLGDSFDDMKVRAKAKDFNFPYLYDGETEATSRQYGPVTTPHAFVFDKGRKLRYQGRIDDSERPQYVKTHDLKDAIDAVLAGREPAATQTKVFGCSIKWAGKEDAARKFVEKVAGEPVAVAPIDADGLKALRKNAPPAAKDGDKAGKPAGPAKLRLVNVWATWCGPCVTEFPELVEMNRMYRKRAFETVTVAAQFPDEKDKVLAFLHKQQASTRNVIFGSPDKFALMEAFDKDWSGALPYTLLIAPGGEVLYKQEGPIDPLELKRAIVKALKEDRFKD